VSNHSEAMQTLPIKISEKGVKRNHFNEQRFENGKRYTSKRKQNQQTDMDSHWRRQSSLIRQHNCHEDGDERRCNDLTSPCFCPWAGQNGQILTWPESFRTNQRWEDGASKATLTVSTSSDRMGMEFSIGIGSDGHFGFIILTARLAPILPDHIGIGDSSLVQL
jgi:hypothetical protein